MNFGQKNASTFRRKPDGLIPMQSITAARNTVAGPDQGTVQWAGPHCFSLMHQRVFSVRMNNSPSETAMEAVVRSPRRLVANSSYFGLAAKTKVTPFLVGT